MSQSRPQKQQQYSLVFGPVRRGEAPTPATGEAEALPAGRLSESRLNPPNRRVRTRTPGGVTGKARKGLPMSILCPQPSHFSVLPLLMI